MILEGELPPGRWIAEIKLCRDLDVSRTSLRESLKVLAAEGYVTLLPNRGAAVADIKVEEIEELFGVMEALEGMIGPLAAAAASDRDIAELQAKHRRLIDYHRQGERQLYFDLNQDVHLTLAALTGNRTLATLYGDYSAKIRRARYFANLSHARWSESVDEHAAFTAALAARDGALLGRLLQDHLRHTGIVVCDTLRDMHRQPSRRTALTPGAQKAP